MRFDEAKRSLEISVRELAESDGFERIGFEKGEGWNRLGLGAELHARVLKSRTLANPKYQSEVHLQLTVPLDDWTATITGRMDGCVELPTGWLIEEFKSAYVTTQEIRRSGGAFERHQRQLLIYCHLWTQLGNTPVNGSLVYVDLASGEEVIIPVPYDATSQQAQVHRRLQALFAIWKAEAKIRQQKAVAAKVIPFPHTAPRPGQQKMITAVLQAVETQQNLIAEAPTGSGKTAASLYPAFASGLASGRQVVFLTSKTLQQRMAVSALQAMNQNGAFRTIQIRAKEKMCANDRVLCHEDFCPYAKGYPEKMESSKILNRLREKNSHFDPDIVFAEAKREKVCPFEVQLELAQKTDAIVADYNYVFEPGTALRHLSREELDDVILLVDEAHNLPDRARKIFSPELLEENFRAVAGRLLLQPGELFEELSESVESMLELLGDTAEVLSGKETITEVAPPKIELRRLWKEWESKFISYLTWKREMKVALVEDPIVNLHFEWHRFVAILNLYGEGFTCVVEKRTEGLRLAIVCLDPARAIAPIFKAASSTVLISATLSPTEVVRRTLGLEKDRTTAISLPPPFPRENRKVMVLPQVKTTFAAREQNFGPIAKLIAEMSDAQSGNILVLFPSYQFLQKVSERLPKIKARVLVQRPNFSEIERNGIFKTLAAPPPEGILLLAVLGGMYAEGVDYPGELLSGVFVVSPALPQVSFERELLRRYYDETEQAGFEYAYLQPGMTRVIQAAGRLIRSETDRGVIALLCQRFLQEPYVSHLPRDWYDESPLELIARNPAEQIREFFRK